MIQLLPICLINPGTDRVMCTKMRKNANHTDLPALITCLTCLDHYLRNVEWYAHKLEKEKIFEENLEAYKKQRPF